MLQLTEHEGSIRGRRIVKRLVPFILVLVMLATAFAACAAPPTATGSLEQRLDRLVEELEQQRQTLHIPGMAIAIVQDDEVILTHGFGVADI